MIDSRLAQAVARALCHPCISQGMRCVVTDNRVAQAAHLLTLKQQGLRDEERPRQARHTRTQQR